MKNHKCPLCKAIQSKIIYPAKNQIGLTVEDFAVTKTSVKKLEVLECTNCSIVYSVPLKEVFPHYSEVIDENYEKDKGIREREFKIAFETMQNFIPSSAKKVRVLDIGCLTGIFLDYVRKSNNKYDCYGAEPSKWAVKICRQKKLKIKQGYFEKLKYPKNYFNLVTLFDCIEHVEDPGRVIQKACSILQKDGLLVMSTPNIDSVFHKIFKKYFWFIEAMHLFYFSPKTITRLLNKNNVEVLTIKKHYKCLTLGYAIQRIIINLNTFIKFIPPSIVNWSILNRPQIKFYAGQMLVIARKRS